MSQNKSKKYAKPKRQKSPWPFILLVSGGVLLILGVVLAFNRPAQPKAVIEVRGLPNLRVDKEKVDLGNVKLNKVVEVSFQITNVGDQTLRFSNEPYIEILEGC